MKFRTSLQKLFENKMVQLILPSVRLACLVTVLDIAMFATLYSALHESARDDRHFLLFLLLLLTFAILDYRLTKTLTQAIQGYIASIRLKLLARLRKIDVLAFEQMGVESVYTALTLDMKAVSDVAHLMADAIGTVLLVVTGLCYIWLLSWKAFCVSLAVFGIGGLLYASNQFVVKQSLNQARERETRLVEALYPSA